MKARAPILYFLFAAVSAFGQAFAPELAPAATKYKADIAALEAQRASAMAQAARPYATALDAAEKAATAGGNLPAVAAITREREALNGSALAPAFPDGLPKNLQSTRKTCTDALTRLRASETTRRTAIDADYLRALASLQSKAASNPELAQQIAAEKEKLLANVVPGGAAATPDTGGRNAIVNGSFDAADAEGHPTSWKIPDRPGFTFKVVRDGSNYVVRATGTGEPSPVYASQEIPVPARAKTVTLSGKIRGKWENRDTKDGNWGATVDSTFLGADEKKFGGWIILVGGREAGWKTLSKTKDVPDGAKALHIHFGFQFVTGTFDFDEISVEFH